MMSEPAGTFCPADVANSSLALLRAILRMCLRNDALPPGMTQEAFDAAVVHYDITR
jgi:hypothetical protein